jgi:alpha-L-arabinofuranosidase
VYISSNINEEEGILFVKMVNPHNCDVPISINLANATLQSGSVILMTGDSSEAENTTDKQTNVYPQEAIVLTRISGNTISYTAPANSLNIMRLSVTDIR